MAAKLALELFHGRESPTQSLDDWGSQGPVFLVDWVHVTYCWDLRIGVNSPVGEGSFEVINDLVYYDGIYYGDWSVHSIEELERAEGLLARVESYDSTKAFLPETTDVKRSIG